MTAIVEVDNHISVNEDGTRMLDLDKIFENDFVVDDEHEVNGYSYQTVSLRHGVKIAASPRDFVSRIDGKTYTAYDFYSVGGWDENHYNVKSYGMKPEIGPHAFASMLPAVISAHATPKETAYLVNNNDVIVFMGHMFKVIVPEYSRYGNNRISFELIA